MENFIGNSAQKHCKLSVYSSESGGLSIGSPGLDTKLGVFVSFDEIEILTQTIRKALEIKGKVPENTLNSFENFKNLLQLLCLDYLDYVIDIQSNSVYSFSKPKDIWEKLYENQDTGCFVTGHECQDVCNVITDLIKESGWKDAEERINKMKENLVDYKLCI